MPHIAFAARLMPPAVTGGLERLSEITKGILDAEFALHDMANYRGRTHQLPYLLSLRQRIRKLRGSIQGIDGSDASLVAFVSGHGAPSWIRVHGLDFLARRVGYQAYLRRYFSRVDSVVANSEGTRQELCKHFDFDEDKIQVIHPVPYGKGVPAITDQIEPLALFVGRLIPRKGVAEFLSEVWPQVVRRIPQAQFVIVGEGPERSRIAASIQRNSLGKSVSMVGRLPEAEKTRLLRRACVGIMYNRPIRGDWEGFGMVAAENAIAGIPTVGTDIEGLQDSIIEGVTGLRIPLGKPTHFAEEVISFLDSPTMLNRQRMQVVAEESWGMPRYKKQYLSHVRGMIDA